MDGDSRMIRSLDQPGFPAEHALRRNMQQEVAALLGRSQTSFPGAQPVSFARKHLDELLREDYFVCEKSDGIRYLLYMTEDGGREIQYLIDRRNDFYFVESDGHLHFPLPHNVQEFHRATLLDGELVMDDLGAGRREPKYIVFDCLVLDGQVLMSKELSKRLGYFHEQVFKPYRQLLKNFPEERAEQPFFVEMKDMQNAYNVPSLFDMIKSLRHGNDGLIFTCLKSEYRPGTDPHILKWKEADENTIDFQWRLTFPTVEPNDVERADGITDPFIDYDAVPEVALYAYHGGGAGDSYQHYAPLHIEEAEWEVLKALGDPLDERIVECYMDGDKRWRMMRFRDDKEHGNHISVVNSVVESIRDGVTRQELEQSAQKIRNAWKTRAQKH